MAEIRMFNPDMLLVVDRLAQEAMLLEVQAIAALQLDMPTVRISADPEMHYRIDDHTDPWSLNGVIDDFVALMKTLAFIERSSDR